MNAELSRASRIKVIAAAITALFSLVVASPRGWPQTDAPPKKRMMEHLGRGLVAVPEGSGKVFVSWRFLGTDPEGIAFNVYRQTRNGPAAKLNGDPITRATHFVDTSADLSQPLAYFVRPVREGLEGEPSASLALPAGAPVRPYLTIPLKTPEGYTANDAAVGDLDGDGEYEIVVKLEMRPFDNSQRGVCPGTTKLDAYRLDGRFLWRIDLGKNIREGVALHAVCRLRLRRRRP